jgi:glycosyltransferase involved in cell wall biosynthesis
MNEEIDLMEEERERIVWALMAAKNEAENIGNVIDGVKKYVNQILVINDGSKDDTANIALKHGAQVISHPINFGKGTAIRNGWLWILWTQKLHPDDLIVMIDSDGQHSPDDIPKAIKYLDENNLDMVVGKRDLKVYPLFKKFGNYMLSKMASVLSGIKIEDGECGFRILRYEMMNDLLKYINAQGFEIEMEMNIVAARKGYKIGFIGISSPTYHKGKGQTIKGGLKNGYAGLKTWLKIKTGWLK